MKTFILFRLCIHIKLTVTHVKRPNVVVSKLKVFIVKLFDDANSLNLKFCAYFGYLKKRKKKKETKTPQETS